MQTIATITLPATELVSETSYSSRSLGKHESTMTLYADGSHYFIEWDVPAIETTEHIGLRFEHKTLTDYDGVFSLPREAVAFIRAQGFIVPAEFED
jgi:hypothetical protein